MDIARSVRSLWSAARGRFRHGRKTTAVICPVAELPAEVALDSNRHIESCSRRPETEGCGETCMPQIEFSDGNLEDFIARYEGKPCASCGVVMTGEDWYRSRLAILKATEKSAGTGQPGSSSREQTAPICSTCYSARMPGAPS